MSTPSERAPTPIHGGDGTKTVVFTKEAIETITRQFKHAAEVGEAYGYDSATYIAEVGSLHACWARVLTRTPSSCRIMVAGYRDDKLSLDVVDEANFELGLIFFPEKRKAKDGLVAGEYSLHS